MFRHLRTFKTGLEQKTAPGSYIIPREIKCSHSTGKKIPWGLSSIDLGFAPFVCLYLFNSETTFRSKPMGIAQ